MEAQKHSPKKFRVWDGEQMLYDAFLVQDGGELKAWRDWRDWHDGLSPIKGDLLQYIGRKDKNGVEIYAGDIVDAKSYRPGSPDIVREVVKYSEGLVGWDPFCRDPLDHVAVDGCHIVGNIYENPELLQEAEQKP